MGPPTVTVVGGEQASGFASMLAEVLAANVADYHGRAWVASRARGSVVLAASDRDVAVTITFGRSDITIADGSIPGIPFLAGPWLTMADLCSGGVSPVRAIVRRELHVGPTTRLDTLAAAGFVLSVPTSYYDEHRDRGKVLSVAAVATGLVALVVVATRAARRSNTSPPQPARRIQWQIE